MPRKIVPAASGSPGRPAAALLRSIPQVDEVLKRPALQEAAARHGRALVASLLRERLLEIRSSILGRRPGPDGLQDRLAGLEAWVLEQCQGLATSSLRPVVNATGVVIHTNLGRAVLSERAARRVVEVARAYTTLEYDLERGGRGSRSSHLERLLSRLFPGRGSLVVNNNAGAVLLALNTLAEGREVVVSRGELVEIGGSFRIPDVMRKSGALLREVGTTNKTRLSDYEKAIGSATGLLLKVHTSNYRIVGFTQAASLEEVCALGKRRRVPVLMDQGSGNLLDLSLYGIRNEPSVQQALAAGADVVCCSGDKLLGGPQAGLIVGRPALVRAMKDNPLSRALRVDKMTCAALETTLLEFARGRAAEEVPALRMLAAGPDALEARARRLVAAIEPRLDGRLGLAIVAGASLSGGGSAPEEGLPTALIAIRAPGLSPRAVALRLRRFRTPVIARIEGGRVLLDLRTVLEEQDEIVGQAILAAATASEGA